MYCNAVVDKEQYDELMNKYLELQKQTTNLQNLNEDLTKERDSFERAYTRTRSALEDEMVERRRYSEQVDMYEKMFAKTQYQTDNAIELANKYKELVKRYKEENSMLVQRIKKLAVSRDGDSSMFSQTTEETFK